MKIAIFGNKQGNEKDLKHSATHFMWGFQNIGDEVDYFHWSEQDKVEKKYDFYMFVDSSEPYEIREDLHPLVVYNGDTHMPQGLERDLLRSKNADLVFNGNLEFGRNLLREKGINAIWLPLGFDNRSDEFDIATEKTLDIAMSGHPNSAKRVELWSWISNTYPQSMVGDLTTEQYISGYSRAKIVVNQPTEPFDMIYNNRLVEAMSFGCMVLQKKLSIKSIEYLFEPNKEFVYWETIDDLKIKIDFYLQNDSLRKKIALAGYKKARSQYSYRDLVKVIKNYVLNLK